MAGYFYSLNCILAHLKACQNVANPWKHQATLAGQKLVNYAVCSEVKLYTGQSLFLSQVLKEATEDIF